MMEFTYNAQPGRVVFGIGAIRHLAREIEHLGANRALVLSTPEQREGAQRVADMLGSRAAGIFDRAAMHVPVDLANLGADFYAANAHKWLGAPKGAGFLHVRPEHQERVDAAIVSWGYEEGSTFTERVEQQGTRDPDVPAGRGGSRRLSAPRAICGRCPRSSPGPVP